MVPVILSGNQSTDSPADSGVDRKTDPRPSDLTRRDFLRAAAVAAGTITISGCWGSSATRGVYPADPLALTPTGMLLDTDFKDPFAGGELLGYIPFREENAAMYPIGEIAFDGHDARRVIDLATLLMPETRNTPSESFYIRTEYPDKLVPPAAWKIKLGGNVKQPRDILLKDLLPEVKPRGPVLLECAGNARELQFGLLSVAEWEGIPIERFLEIAQPKGKVESIFINGFDDDTRPSRGNHSQPTCSWIFTADQLVKAGAILATGMNGGPIPKNQGHPVRLIVPGWYGCTEAKWVDEIRLVDNNQPATLQMQEFATRTLQEFDWQGPPPRMANEYRPGTIDQAALPVRVELWKLDGKLSCRVVGITWGGPNRTAKLKIRFDSQRIHRYVPVQFCTPVSANTAYGIWFHRWEPTAPGRYIIKVAVDDPHVLHRKQSIGHYDRIVYVPTV